jgi:hypothetical protein
MILSDSQVGQSGRYAHHFIPNDVDAFDGILSFLHYQNNGNVHTKGIVTFSARDLLFSDRPPEVIVDVVQERQEFQHIPSSVYRR